MKPKKKPKKKPGGSLPKAAVVDAVDLSGHDRAAKSLRRVISHALASGMRNVLRVDVQTHFYGSDLTGRDMGDAYREVRVTFIDRNMKAKW
jgi:hypothetical protein